MRTRVEDVRDRREDVHVRGGYFDEAARRGLSAVGSHAHHHLLHGGSTEPALPIPETHVHRVRRWAHVLVLTGVHVAQVRMGRLIYFEIRRDGPPVRVRVPVEARLVPVHRDGRLDVRRHHVPHPPRLVEPRHEVEAMRPDVHNRPARRVQFVNVGSHQRGGRSVQGDDVQDGEDRDVVVDRLVHRGVLRRVRDHGVDVVRGVGT